MEQQPLEDFRPVVADDKPPAELAVVAAQQVQQQRPFLPQRDGERLERRAFVDALYGRNATPEVPRPIPAAPAPTVPSEIDTKPPGFCATLLRTPGQQGFEERKPNMTQPVSRGAYGIERIDRPDDVDEGPVAASP